MFDAMNNCARSNFIRGMDARLDIQCLTMMVFPPSENKIPRFCNALRRFQEFRVH